MAEQETLKWRARGDKQFQRALEGRLPVKLKVDLLEKAHHCYSRSHDTAHDYSAAATATKKCILTKEFMYHDCGITDINTRASVLRDLVYYLQTLYEEGREADLGDAVCAKVISDFDQYVQESFRLFKEMEVKQAVWWMEEFVTIMGQLTVKCSLYREIFERLHEQSKNDMEERNYGPASGLLQDCKNTLDKVSELPHLNEVFTDWITQKYTEIKSQHTAAKALFTMVKADELLDELKKNYNAETDLDSLYEIIDTYTKVIQMTENKENEVAAEAYNRLGKVFTEMIKDTERGKMYFQKSMALAKEFWSPDFIDSTTSTNTQMAKSRTFMKVTETPKESAIADVHYPKTSPSLGNKIDEDKAARTHTKTEYSSTDPIVHDRIDLEKKSKLYKSDNKAFLAIIQEWFPPCEPTRIKWFGDPDCNAETDEQILGALRLAIQDYSVSIDKTSSARDIAVYVYIREDLRRREAALLVGLDKKHMESEKRAHQQAKERLKEIRSAYKKHKDVCLYLMRLITTFPPQHRSKQIDWSSLNLEDSEDEDIVKVAVQLWRQSYYDPDEQKDQTTTWQWVSSKIQHILHKLLADDKKRSVHQKGASVTHSEQPRTLPTLRTETRL